MPPVPASVTNADEFHAENVIKLELETTRSCFLLVLYVTRLLKQDDFSSVPNFFDEPFFSVWYSREVATRAV